MWTQTILSEHQLQATVFVLNFPKQTLRERALAKDVLRTQPGLNSNGEDAATITWSERGVDVQRTARTPVYEDLTSFHEYPDFLCPLYGHKRI